MLPKFNSVFTQFKHRLTNFNKQLVYLDLLYGFPQRFTYTFPLPGLMKNRVATTSSHIK